MKQMLAMATIGAVAVFMTGCEWSGGGEDGGWSSSGISADFSGVYKSSDGSFVVQKAAPSGAAGVEDASDSLGTGNGATATFSKTVAHAPITKGSVQVSDGVESFTDPSGSGTLTGTAGGNGSVNYSSGKITVNFNNAPGVGKSVLVDYSYYKSGTSENPESGSSSPIMRFNVQQMGNKLRFVDNNGGVYEGSLGKAQTTAQGAVTATSSATAQQTIAEVYQFNVSGTTSGTKVELTGVFQVNAVVYFSSTIEVTATTGSMGLTELYRIASYTMEATWIEENGKTGVVNAVGPANQKIQTLSE